jgi:Na+-transporting NADH:ubiquinone oxidoreductase subunit C
MAVDRNSNAFTFGFAIAMVIVVGTTLAFLSITLKPYQLKNAKDKKMMNILGAINVESNRANAEEMYDTYIVDAKVLNSKGEAITSDVDAFDIDVSKQYKNKNVAVEDRIYPLFIAEKKGEKYYIIPVAGAGLWGPIWGFISVGNDLTTIYGARFDHKGETPGLGAEISSYDKFQKQWEGKEIRNPDGTFHSILVSKTPVSNEDPFAVDGITGGTITSKALEEMVNRSVVIYVSYFETVQN